MTDLKMEGMDGLEFIESLPKEPFDPPVIVMTAYGTIASAVEAIKRARLITLQTTGQGSASHYRKTGR
jgi:ActR/RegA family two-component response regulator